MTTQTPDAVREALEPLRKLFDAAEGQWPKTPWKVIPSDGKPIIASERGGNLFRGYIATWQEAELVVGIVNALPAILAALDSRAGDAGEGCVRPLQWNEPHPSHSYPNWTAGDANIMFCARINTSEPLSRGKYPLSINGSMIAEKFDTVEAAKAYAQRNYAARILAALSATPAPAVDADEGECTCQRYPTHCANDCPLHGLEDAPAVDAQEDGRPCDTCKGNGEVVTDWERYMHGKPGDTGDEGTKDCPDCDGTGRVDGPPAVDAVPAGEVS